MKGIAHQFADVIAKLEDLHSIAVEGQRADSAPDVQRMLIHQLGCGVRALDRRLGIMVTMLGRGKP